jgi:hypothetical protein
VVATCAVVAVLALSAPAGATGTETLAKTTAAETAADTNITVAGQFLSRQRAKRATREHARQVHNEREWTTYYGAGYCVRFSRRRVDCQAWVGNQARECSWYVVNRLRPNGSLQQRFGGQYSCYG